MPTRATHPSHLGSQTHITQYMDAQRTDTGPTDDPQTANGSATQDPPVPTHGMVMCSGVTRDGYSCGFAARRGTGLCINHDPAYREQQAENSRRGMEASLARRRAGPDFIPLVSVDLSSRGGIQAAIEALLRLELSGRISATRSRNIARTLSLALRSYDFYRWRNFDAPEFAAARASTLASLDLMATFLAQAEPTESHSA